MNLPFYVTLAMLSRTGKALMAGLNNYFLAQLRNCFSVQSRKRSIGSHCVNTCVYLTCTDGFVLLILLLPLRHFGNECLCGPIPVTYMAWWGCERHRCALGCVPGELMVMGLLFRDFNSQVKPTLQQGSFAVDRATVISCFGEERLEVNGQSAVKAKHFSGYFHRSTCSSQSIALWLNCTLHLFKLGGNYTLINLNRTELDGRDFSLYLNVTNSCFQAINQPYKFCTI